MGEGRNEILVNSLDIEKRAKKKAIKPILLIVLFIIIFFVILNFIDERVDIGLIIGISIPIIALLYICYFFLVKEYKEQEIEKISSSLVEACLSANGVTEVIPIKAYHHKEFILGLVDIAKFYAEISEDDAEYVDVWVEILNEGGTRFLEHVYKGCFFDCYSIVEKDKQEDIK